jgi:L-alanine-DL-glutamate epimerase-like enolase superfamily enzyme
MKIVNVQVYKADIPLVMPFRIALGEVAVAKNVLIKIKTDGGLYGLGEASPFTPIVGETQATDLAAARDLAVLLIGKDPLNIEHRLRELRSYLVHNATVISAFDMALYDLLGKAADLPLYAVLAGGKRTILTDRTVGIDTPEKMAEEALHLKERGFPAVKIKLGTTPEADIERIRRIRETLGPEIPLRIDANQGWDCVCALQALKEMEDQGIQYCEQPVAAWDFECLRKVSANTTIPIMADESLFDEHDAFRLLSMGACDYFNIKLSKAGGIHTALKINAIAEAAGVSCMMGCMSETRLGLTAAAHVVSARPNIQFADLDSADMLSFDPVIGGLTYGEAGSVILPDTPGHGADIDPSFLKELESFVAD